MPRRKRRSRNRKFTRKMQKKLVILFIFIVIALVGLNLRITYINAEKGEQYTKQVLDQQHYDSRTISYKRGDILDVNGTKLATSKKVYNVILDAKAVNEKDAYRQPTVNALVTYFDIEEEKIIDVLDNKPDSQYNIMQYKVSYEDAKVYKEMMNAEYEGEKASEDPRLKIKGIWLEDDYDREYPYGTLASHVIGFTVDGNLGNGGLESQYNSELNGINGREYGYWNDDAELERTIKPAVDGNHLITHIDVNLQSIVEKRIDNFMEGKGALQTSVILMDPNSGAIRAMANSGNYDLNEPRELSGFYSEEEIQEMKKEDEDNEGSTRTLDALNKIWRNYAVSDAFEPGSTIKPLTVAAGLETGAISGGEYFQCEGKLHIGGHDINCVRRSGHGWISLEEGMMNSCNVVLMKVAQGMGISSFSNYQKIFNLGQKTGIDLPGETTGLVYSQEEMKEADLATNSFGQNYTASMVQVAASFCSVINGGYYYQPQIGKQLVDPGGAVVHNIEPVLLKQTVSKRTSNILKKHLLSTVEEGTATPAQVDGYKIGGKTGTAEKYPRGNKKYLISFIGAVPIDNPELVIYVIIDELNDSDQAQSKYATGLSHDIMTEVLEYLHINPSEEKTQEDAGDIEVQTADPEVAEEPVPGELPEGSGQDLEDE